MESPNSASVLLRLNGDNCYKQNRVTPVFKHVQNIYIYTNMFSKCLKFWLAGCCWKNWHRSNTAKQTHCQGDSIHLADNVFVLRLVNWNLSVLYTDCIVQHENVSLS